ncbi:MAG: U32 family peptidase [Anaerotardibacter sp.]
MEQRKIPELLAPAGGMEQLRYAIAFGADAVYLACDKYGLRARAQNFSLDELPEAVKYAHDHGVKVHVTCNAYAHDKDLSDLPHYAKALENAGVDAVIVSDLGVLSIIHETAPSLELHVSTQASVSNVAAARAWYSLGARRVVCAREMSLEEIAALKRDLPEDMEVEVFVHGAMCMAISGRCLISDFLANRAANQGNCVQPCRWGYTLEEPSRPGQLFDIEEDQGLTHIMNSKDLNMLAHLDDLIEAGVDSIKIEGRVKKAFYVATVVNAYRHVLDGEPAEKWQGELETISHRPYHTGFFYGPAEQSLSDDIYVQLYDWVGEVVESTQIEEGLWDVDVYCRNRFYENDSLDLLSPHAPIVPIVIKALRECFSNGDTLPSEIANKAMGTYRFTCDRELKPGDILRAKRKNPKVKN